MPEQEIPGLEFPDVGAKLWFLDQDGKKVRIEIAIEEDYENPLTEDSDYTGEIFSFCSRHNNFLDLVNKGCPTKESARNWLEDEYGPEGLGWCLLSYFEHGNCIWFPWTQPKPPGTEGDFRWDGTRFAGVWRTPKELRKITQPEEAHRELIKERCIAACKLYTSYCNGEVYCFSIKKEDCEDPCSNGEFYSLEYLKETLKEELLELGVTTLTSREEPNDD